MKETDPVSMWLGDVAYAHSGSQNTQDDYRRNFQYFLAFIEGSAQEILKDYESSSDREFKRKYAQLVKGWIAEMQQKDYAINSIKSKVGAVQSFFKHHDLPLAYIPQPQEYVRYHNRDITKEEIALIISVAKPRDRAFFVVMAQSGLRPETLCKLKLKHLEPDWTQGTIPCKIDVPQGLAKGKYQGYFTFMGEESVKFLKDYFASRSNLNPESYLFARAGSEEPMSPKSISAEFNRIVRMLKTNKQLNFEVRYDKPSELRLYTLRKFFKKFTQQAGEEYNEFWMGHKGKGVIDNYRAKDPEFHRQLYSEKAMPFLRIETATPTETEKTIQKQAQEIEELKAKLQQQQEDLEKRIELLEEFIKKAVKPA
jgi:integrase